MIENIRISNHILEEKIMYNNGNNDITIEYDPDIVSKIKELIKEGFDKLKCFVKLKTNEIREISNFSFYDELKLQFREISMKLKELKLRKEHCYFISIKDYILYIVRQNSTDSTFGHCDFTVELFNFFMELFKTNLEFYKTGKTTTDEFKRLEKSFKERYWDYRCIFYSYIYQPSGDFTEEEMYKIHEQLRS
ncbi:hypothetical protein [uncultured Methanobrevibacter sp.]|uniref:hypothetical protein n=1 Tax=uncultured Methanobrevibacter sp. TaxID=253161 RepID=UPI002607A267|nr:hypothetical protein [uncultured Methanobrevibacter sp.]